MQADPDFLSSRPAGCLYLLGGLAVLAGAGLLIGENHGLPDRKLATGFFLAAFLGSLLIWLSIDVLFEPERWTAMRFAGVIIAVLTTLLSALLAW